MASNTDRRKLLDAEAATGATTFPEGWQSIADVDDIEIHVFGMGAGDEVQVQVSNEDTPTNGVADQTFSGAGPHYASLTVNPHQLRVGITADGANGSNITAIALLRKRNG